MSGIFTTGAAAGEGTPADLAFGQTTAKHRYKMPLLPGELGTKAGGNWVPWHMRSATNLAGAISESYALGQWLLEQTQIGMALRPDLYERLVIAVRRAAAVELLDFQRLRDSEAGEALKGVLAEIAADAKQSAGANQAAQEGTNRHDVWETRGRSGIFVGTPEINAQMEELEALLKRCHLVRIPHLVERVIRNTDVNCAGRFDEVLMDERTGKLYIADLKTKRRPFFSLLELWIQLAIYARARYMLTHVGEDARYEDGPASFVDQRVGLVLHMPANSGQEGALPMRVRKIDLEKGWRYALLAQAVVDARSDGKSVESMGDSYWAEDVDLADWATSAVHIAQKG